MRATMLPKVPLHRFSSVAVGGGISIGHVLPERAARESRAASPWNGTAPAAAGTFRRRLRDSFGWDAVVPGMESSVELRRGTTPSAHQATRKQPEGVTFRTGHHTGRAPNDKFVVREPSSEKKVWWGPSNQPLSPERFEAIRRRMLAYLQGKDLFVQDCFLCADPAYRTPVRVITETAWHSLFAHNLLPQVAGVPSELLDPRGTWSDGGAYDKQARHLEELFRENFRQFETEVSSAIASAGPPAASGDET